MLRVDLVLLSLVFFGCNGGDTGDGAAPTQPVVSIQPATPTSADDLSAVIVEDSTAPGGGEVTYRYAWTSDAGGSAEGPTLPAAATTRDETWTVNVTPIAGGESGPPGIAEATVLNAPPSVASVAFDPAVPVSGIDVLCVPVGADVDGDTVTFEAAWTVDGTAVAVAGLTLTQDHFAEGDALQCTVTPSDGTAQGSSASVQAVIGNAPPTVERPRLTPSDATAGDNLTCVPGATSDADGDEVTLTYAWRIDGIVVAGATNAVLTAGSHGRGDVVTCATTPHDAFSAGVEMESLGRTILNTPPQVGGVSVTDPAYSYTQIKCTPSGLSDADGDPVSVVYAWTLNDVAVGTNADTLATAFSKGQVVRCTATPTDTFDPGLPAVDEVTISNTPPAVSSISISPSTATTDTNLTCVVGTQDADGDSVTVHYAWTVDGSAAGGDSSTLSASTFARGDVVVCAATPHDEDGAGTPSQAQKTIANSAPTLASVSLTPGTAYESSTMICTPEGWADADGDSPPGTPVTYSWTVDGSPVAGQTDGTLSGTYFSKNQTVRCTATPTDGTTSGIATNSNTVTISNTAPTLSSVSLTPTTAYETSTMTCAPSGWSDADGDAEPLTPATYSWTVAGATVAGQTGSTLSGTYFSKGQAVRCTATPTDGTASGSATNSNTVTVSNSAPTLTGVTLTPGTAYETSTMTCTPAGWSDADGDSAPTPSATYSWTVAGSPVAGQTGSTLSGTYFSKNQTVRCTATPTDGTTSGSATNSDTVTISNSAPTLASVSLTPSTAYESSTMVCTPDTWSDADGDEVTLTYAWTVNGSAVVETGSTLSGTYFDRGQTVGCTVTPTDGTASGGPTNSNTIIISNSAPTLTGVSLTPTTAYETSTMTCTPAGWADADGDSPPATPVTYAWKVAGSTVAGQTGSTLTGTYFNKAQSVRCTATPTDGTTSGSATDSNSVTVSNSAPTLTSVSLTPTTAYETSTMTCTANGWSDPDGDSQPNTYATYAWTVAGSAVAPTTSTLTGTYFSKTQGVRCTATPTDGTTSGTGTNSNTVTVSNSAPGTPSTPTITPTSPAAQADDLVCGMSGSTDADGDGVTYQAEWQFYDYSNTWVSFSHVQSGTQVDDEVPAADTASCRSYRCRARASDGTGTSGWSGYSTSKTVSSAPGCGSCATGDSTAGPYSAYGRCWFLSDPGRSCDEACKGQSYNQNVTPTAWNDWPDNCSGAQPDDVSTWFYDHGNPGGWGTSTTSTPYQQVGYGYTGSFKYGKCAAGTTTTNVGAWPADTNGSGTRSMVCSCGSRFWEYEAAQGSTYSQTKSLVWGTVFKPTTDTALYRYAAHMSVTSPVGATCTMNWYVFENTAGDYDGPWVLLKSGSSTSGTTSAQWHYTPDDLSVLLRNDYSYWIAFGTSCATHARTGDTGFDNLPVMGTALGYCYKFDYDNPPTSPTCMSAPTGAGVPYDAYYVSD